MDNEKSRNAFLEGYNSVFLQCFECEFVVSDSKEKATEIGYIFFKIASHLNNIHNKDVKDKEKHFKDLIRFNLDKDWIKELNDKNNWLKL